MSKQTNIRRRPGSPTYYARVTVPVALRNARANAGLHVRPEVWRSLRTTDPKVAGRAGPAVVEQIKRDFDRELEMLARGEVPTERRRHVPTDHELEERLFSLLTVDLRDDQVSRFRDPRQEEKERLLVEAIAKARAAAEGIADPKQAQLAGIIAALDELVAVDRKGLRAEMRSIEREAILAADPRDSFGHLAEAIIEDNHWDIPPESSRFQVFCQRLQSMRLRALDTMKDRDQGRFEDPLPTPATNIATLPRTASAGRGERLLDLLDRYLKDEGPRLSPEEVEKKRLVIRLFSEHVGADRAVASITRADLRDFKQALEHLPRAATTKREFRGLTFPAIIKKNAQLRREAIGRSTQNNYISTVGAYFRWLGANAYTDETDLSRGLLVKVDKSETARDSYSAQEIDAILRLPVFAGALSIDELDQTGEVLIADWRFWIPMLCLFTGSRLGEIAQLRVEDVREVSGEITLHITDEGADMSVKTKYSVRIVPVHRELRRLGFERYLASLREREVVRLFPELRKNLRGRTSSDAGSWWRKYLQRHGINGNAYRFRHTFADALRDAGALDAEIGSLLGHSGGTMTERYGNVSQVTLARRSALVNAVIIEQANQLRPR